MTTGNELFSYVRRIQELLVDRATGRIMPRDKIANSEYGMLRKKLIENSSINSNALPSELIDFLDLDVFWDERLSKMSKYSFRRQHISSLFRQLLHDLETDSSLPLDKVISDKLSVDFIKDYWNRALTRRNSDPEGAITMARTLLEATCKKILDELKENYSEKDDLPKLYKSLADKLNMSPDKQTEQIFKQILGGCQSVVNGLGSLRNKHSDAHGIVKKSYKPSVRHAELAVNLAGTMATFLFDTFSEYKNKLPSTK